MKLSTWTATVLATPAVATGVCLLCASTAQAAPDDAGTETSSAAASETAATSSTARDETASTEDSGSADGGDADDGDEDGDLDVTDGSELTDGPDIDGEAEELDDTSAETGPHYVPTTVRQTLVTGDAVDADGDGIEDDPVDEDEDGDDEPADDSGDDSDDDEEPAPDTVPVALAQISEASEDLNEATWDSGNVLAGLAAILPQMYLSGATASLERWQQNHALLQDRYAATYGDPFAHWLAGLRIESSVQRTIRVQDQIEAAQKWLTVVGWFGPDDEMDTVRELLDNASDNALVYQIIDIEMQYNNQKVRTEPVMWLSVNGGEYVKVLVDTGSRGLLIDPRDVGVDDIGPVVDRGKAAYGDGQSVFYWDAYKTTVDVGDDVVTSPTDVMVVTLGTAGLFARYNGDYVGVLGVGPNSGGPGKDIPFRALPGMLGQGLMFDEPRRRLILGLNPYPARVTVPGAPANNVMVKVGDYDPKVVEMWTDSGGILGDFPNTLIDGEDNVPVGTVISVYTEDGETLLYSYKTTKVNSPGFTEEESGNTGFTPFSLGMMYFSYSGVGSTSYIY